MRAERCKELIRQLACGSIEQPPANLAQFASHGCLHGVSHARLTTLLYEFNL
jgi:hypothetical protein